MQVIRSVNTMSEIIQKYHLQHKQIGFVATMGFLHEGHLQLMKEAKKENAIVVASIFVNPLQFGPNEDFEKYPRDEQSDTLLAEKTGVDVLFIPTVKEMYPHAMLIHMSIRERVNVLCGHSRPGHFDGVLTVLTKLFHIIRPTKVYFGLKDAQQVAVVDALIQDLNFPMELIGLPTVREKDGLAKSSRNVNLKEHERREAVWIYKGLLAGQQLLLKGKGNPALIIKEVTQTVEKHISGKIDYIKLLSYPALKPVSTINQQVILAAAVYFDEARLIDNLILHPNGKIINRYN
nr:pantoate--beta-alanine ligase [Priestia megaterium]